MKTKEKCEILRNKIPIMLQEKDMTINELITKCNEDFEIHKVRVSNTIAELIECRKIYRAAKGVYSLKDSGYKLQPRGARENKLSPF